MTKEKIDPQLKKDFEQEGFDEQAALLAGSKEEVEQALKRLETEGRCANAASYVRMHKAIAVPAAEVPEKIRQQKGKGWIGTTLFNFIDSQGNIAEVKIDYEKIASIAGKRLSSKAEAEEFITELEEHGFEIAHRDDSSYDPIYTAILERQSKVEQEAREIKKREFNF